MHRCPQPRLSDVAALLAPDDELKVMGASVDLEPGMDLTCYRVVQEALTNARRHGVSPATVQVEWSPTQLTVQVTNAIRVASPADGGHGLVGMRERVEMYDGVLDAGRDEERWVVRAVLPLSPAGVRS